MLIQIKLHGWRSSNTIVNSFMRNFLFMNRTSFGGCAAAHYSHPWLEKQKPGLQHANDV